MVRVLANCSPLLPLAHVCGTLVAPEKGWSIKACQNYLLGSMPVLLIHSGGCTANCFSCDLISWIWILIYKIVSLLMNFIKFIAFFPVIKFSPMIFFFSSYIHFNFGWDSTTVCLIMHNFCFIILIISCWEMHLFQATDLCCLLTHYFQLDSLWHDLESLSQTWTSVVQSIDFFFFFPSSHIT